MKVSIVIPTWNGEDEVGECLDGIFRQEVDFPFDVLCIDSSSTDRTREVIARYPVRLLVIPQSEFDHGDTRNLGALATDGDRIVFLVQDAYPERNDWLRTLVGNLDDERVAGAFSRVVPRPTAGPLVKRGVRGDLNFRTEREERRILDRAEYDALDPLQRRIFCNFNDVASCLRRDVWRKLPYPRLQFGEDLLWGKGAIEAGHTIVFDPDAPVVHSHEYDARTLRSRTRIDGWVNRAYLDRICVARWPDVWTMTRRAAAEDRAFLREEGVPTLERWKLSLLSYRFHFLEFQGAYEGGLTEDRLRAPALVPEGRLKVLLVVHGFPPESVAGTEVLTLALARALAARGHEVVVVHRTGDPELPDHSLHEGEASGFRTWRIVNHLDYPSIRETYHCRPIEDHFRTILERERPDVVHFEHLIHLSAALPRICRDHGVATVVTLNDFWFRCARVQLVRPDRTRCEGKPPILGCAACIAKRPGWIDFARAVSRPLRRPIAWFARRLAKRLPAEPDEFWKHVSNVFWLALRPETMNAELAAADFVLCPSPFLKRKMVEAGFPAARLVVSDYGMETGWLARYERRPAPGRLRIGFVGSLVWYKGLDVLARAFQRITDPRAELHVFGDDRSRDEFRATRREVERAVRRPGLTFHGPFAPDAIGEVLSGIDVLVVPSVWFENSPLTIHEAFQARVPVVVSDHGGMRDLVEEEAGGLRFPPGDDLALARVLQRFLDDDGLAGRLAAAAPPVKTTASNAAEMEMRYRQAIGLARADAVLRTLDLQAPTRTEGEVRREGDAIVLGPSPSGRARWALDVEVESTVAVDLVVVLRHEPSDAEQGGEVRRNGRRIADLGPAGPLRDAARTTTWRVPIRLEEGATRIELRNADPRGTDAAFLRVAEVRLERTPFSRGA
ncbi:MAG: glycosyltransferase [Planctomycetota bacterium JB042]